jgi:hypothetical protein
VRCAYGARRVARARRRRRALSIINRTYLGNGRAASYRQLYSTAVYARKVKMTRAQPDISRPTQ